MTQSVTSDAGPDAVIPRKSTLFCPGCDHASTADGDWIRRTHGETVAYVCPVCATSITERPRRADAPSVWYRLVRRSIDVWQASVAASCSGLATTWPPRPPDRGLDRRRNTEDRSTR